MKAIEIAQNNKVNVDEVLKICNDLDISCKSGDESIEDKDAFLIKKRIETMKLEKAKEMEKKLEDSRLKKKIKLKRKIPKNPHQGAEGEEEADSDNSDAEPVHKPVESETKPKKIEPRTDSRTSHPNTARTQGTRPERTGYQGNKPDGRPGYQGNRPDGRPGYQGNKPDGRPGYQGNKPDGRPGYQGSRPDGRPGYQGNKPDGRAGQPGTRTQGTGYQGNRSNSGRPGQSGTRGPGQGGARPLGNRPFAGKAGQGRFDRDNKPGEKEGSSEILQKSDEKRTERKTKRKVRDQEKIDKKFKKTERDDIQYFEKSIKNKRRREDEEPVKIVSSIPEKIDITENVTVSELARKLNVKANDVIARLIKLGVMATINQVLDSDTASILSAEYGSEVNVVSLYDETVIKEEQSDDAASNFTRAPIVTVMGHVDHGKTKLLDSIRSADVAGHEHGGITQHIGAYQVNVNGQKVTFLDTPGHEAFTTMRARGASVTDIVILVVAANDGVMPQTIEAINHAKAAKVPIIVAINKVDLPEANPEKVKQELTAYELIPEEWGGTTLYCEISAKLNKNIDALLELVLMQAEILELKANPTLRAKGTVIESKLDPGRGPVCSLLVQNGTLKIGDPFVVGIYSGKVRAMFDDKGFPVTEAEPSRPVEVLGVDGIPSAGDPFQQVSSEKYSKQISQKRQELKRIESAKQVKKVTLEDLNDMIKEGAVQEVVIIMKADVDGSVQALKDALEKLSTSEVKVKVIHAAAGGINESDVMLASASNAIIIGYHVRPTPKIQDLAESEKVTIKTYNIIFEVTKDVKDAMEGMLAPDIIEEVTGAGEVRQVFKISKIGTIAGAVIVKGKVHRDYKVRLMREGIIIYEGALSSLKRFKDDAKEVEVGQECGIGLVNFNNIKTGDTFETYRLVEVAKKLSK
ncbi:MAG: translation initiation factor IF-2 [Spirochaetes bacterium]|nr:translation initiation factor IF-2 [Spirochaetota bacterium]